MGLASGRTVGSVKLFWVRMTMKIAQDGKSASARQRQSQNGIPSSSARVPKDRIFFASQNLDATPQLKKEDSKSRARFANQTSVDKPTPTGAISDTSIGQDP